MIAALSALVLLTPSDAAPPASCPLTEAVRAGQVDRVRTLLRSGTDPDQSCDESWPSPLFVAAGSRAPEIVTILLEAGADPDPDLPTHQRPLYAVARSYDSHSFTERTTDVEIAALLLEAGAELDLYSAVLLKRPNDFSGPVVLDLEVPPSRQGSRIFFLEEYVRLCRSDVVEAILSANIAGGEPLFDPTGAALVALVRCDAEMFVRLHHGGAHLTGEMLVEAAKHHTISTDGNTSEMIIPASQQRALWTARYLLDEGAPATPDERSEALHYAIQADNAELVALLLSRGAQVDWHDRHGGHVALCKIRSRTVLSILLDAGATVNGPSSSAHHPISHQVRPGDPDLLVALLEAGASPDHGRTGPLLHEVIRTRDPGSALQLLEYGAQTERTDSSDRTALHIAVEYGQLPVVEALLALGADPTPIARGGWTPLHTAVMGINTPGDCGPPRGGIGVSYDLSEASLTMINWLLDAGADAWLRNDQGRLAIELLSPLPALESVFVFDEKCVVARRARQEKYTLLIAELLGS